MHKDLINLVEKAKNKGIEEVTVVTNGRILASSKYTKQLVSAGLDLFSITIHSSDEVLHNSIARTDSWKQTMEGIHNVLDEGGKCILNLVAGRENYEDLPNSIPVLLASGVHGIIVSSVVGSIGAEVFHEEHSLDPREYANLIESLKDTPNEVAFLHELPLCLLSKETFISLAKRDKLGYGCHIGTGGGLSVNPEGRIIPCNSMFHLPLIDLFSGTRLSYQAEEFLELWFKGKEMWEIRQHANVYRSQICAKCNLWDMCNSGCPLTWVNLEPKDYISDHLIDIQAQDFCKTSV